jgi:hypothetical protein
MHPGYQLQAFEWHGRRLKIQGASAYANYHYVKSLTAKHGMVQASAFAGDTWESPPVMGIMGKVGSCRKSES